MFGFSLATKEANQSCCKKLLWKVYNSIKIMSLETNVAFGSADKCWQPLFRVNIFPDELWIFNLYDEWIDSVLSMYHRVFRAGAGWSRKSNPSFGVFLDCMLHFLKRLYAMQFLEVFWRFRSKGELDGGLISGWSDMWADCSGVCGGLWWG